MRKILLPLLASLAIASPALANEARIEARGGVIWSDGVTEEVYGLAAGYDFDLGQTAFAGVEVSGDKIADTGTKVAWGFSGRVGAKVAETGKFYAVGGYMTEPCDLCEDSWHAGAGYEHGFGNNLYGKVEYRHHFVDNAVPDSDTVGVGLGVRF